MKKKSAWAKHYSGELVAGVADEHAGLPHSAVPHRDALDEPGHAGCHIQGPRWKKEISRARQRTRGEARSLFFCCLLWLWLLVEEERRKSDREGSHAFSLLSQVPLTGSHSCLRGHLFPSLSLFFLSRCPGAASVSDNGLLGSGSSSVLLRMGSTILGLRTVWVI